MNNRVPKIAQLLRRWCAEQSGRTCEAMFTKFMEAVLTKTEAKRLFEAYANEPILKFYSQRMCTITVHQDHFNIEAVAEMANLIDLSEKIDPRYRKPKGKTSSEMKDLAYNEGTGEFENMLESAIREKGAKEFLQKVKEKANPLEVYTTEELAAELTRRGWVITYGII